MDPVVKQLSEAMAPLERRVLEKGYKGLSWSFIIDKGPLHPVGITASAEVSSFPFTQMKALGCVLSDTIESAVARMASLIERLEDRGAAAHASLGRELGLNPDGSLMEEYRQHG